MRGTSELEQLVTKPEQSDVDADPKPNRYVWSLAMIAALNSVNSGYNIGSVGGAADLMRNQMGWSAVQTEVFVASTNCVSVLGALCAPAICDGLGRRRSFSVAAAAFILGVLLVISMPASSVGFIAMMAGRVLCGLGVGLSQALDSLYIAEIAPKAHRGLLVSLCEIGINLGILLGMCADYGLLELPANSNWRVMIGLGLLAPTALFALSLTVLPETPRWLLANGQRDEARAVLQATHADATSAADIDSIIRDIDEEVAADIAESSAHGSQSATGWAELLPWPTTLPLRRMVLAGVGLALCQQTNGSETLIYFAPELLNRSGFQTRRLQFGAMCAIGLVKTVFIVPGMLLVDAAGRRPCALLSNALMTVALVGVAVTVPAHAATSSSSSSASFLSSPAEPGVPTFLVFLCAFMAAFSLGAGPVTWVGASEVFPLRLRAKGLCLATASNRLVATLTSGSALSLSTALGTHGFFAFYAACTAVSYLFIYCTFPETKGLSLESAPRMFAREDYDPTTKPRQTAASAPPSSGAD